MKNRQKELRDRIARRRKLQPPAKRQDWSVSYNAEDSDFDRPAAYEVPPESYHPLFRKEVYYFKILASLCLFLAVAIMFKKPVPALSETRVAISHYMKQEFEFAAAKDWYQTTFGKPLVFFPSDKKPVTASKENEQYALPASGKIAQTFETDGQGIMIETDKDSPVEAAKGGTIIFIGEKEKLGKTVVVQHSDKSESWYGHLSTVDVSLYENVPKGKILGKVTNKQEGAKGTFYLAIKKGSTFVDPRQVIPFD
ncbi:M23 family metallopeptidase [Peribacillus kribbensis]|uniref:M23 family metallopeptidase n=1 Tax=Peribacillus kribbensis TaxID=356658 RepID=UPI0003F86C05|nr:M23 family metallopeptidase [Peribacillus kribbensis]